MPDLEVVPVKDVLLEAGAKGQVKLGTFLQRSGLALAASVGTLASVVTLALIVKWICYAPPVPLIAADMNREKARLFIESYKQLQQIALQPFTTLFDSIFMKALL